MGENENLGTYQVNDGGFLSIDRNSSRAFNNKRSLFEAANVDIGNTTGIIRAVNGYSELTAYAPPTGVTFYDYFNSGIVNLAIGTIAGVSYIYTFNIVTGVWDQKKTLTFAISSASSTSRFLYFNSRYYWIGSGERYSSNDEGVTWTTTNFTSFPGGFVPVLEPMGARLYTYQADLLYWSSLPDINGLHTWNSAEYNVRIGDGRTQIRNIIALGNRMIIFGSDGIYQFTQSGDLQVTTRLISSLAVGFGTNYKNAVIYDNLCYFNGLDISGFHGIFVTDGETVRMISDPIKDIVRRYTPLLAGFSADGVKFTGSLNTGSDNKYIDIHYIPSRQTFQYRLLPSQVYSFGYHPGRSSDNLRFLSSDNKIYWDERQYTDNTFLTGNGLVFNNDQIQSSMMTDYFSIGSFDEKNRVRKLFIRGTNIQYLNVQIRTAEDDNWTTLNNQVDGTDIFGAKLNLVGTQYQVRITTTQSGWEIEDIFIKYKNDERMNLI